MYTNRKLTWAAMTIAAGLGAPAVLAHDERPKGGMMQDDAMPMMGMMGEMMKMMENCNKMMQASLEKRDSTPAPAQPENQRR